MALLQQVQTDAIDDKVPISTLLRRCQVLAAHLKNAEFAEWVNSELNGYDSDDKVPEYRVLGAHATGNIAGPFGSGWNNITIPPAILPDWGKKFAEQVRFTQPIATIEQLGKSTGHVTFPWPGNLLGYMQTREGNKFDGVLYAAAQTVSSASVLGIVDTVRNRVLEFALKLEAEAPAAGEPDVQPSVSNDRVTHLYQTVIHGDVVGNVATGENAKQSTSDITVKKNDLEGLMKALLQIGVPASEIAGLEAALNEDPPANSIAEKPKTTAWLGELFGKTLSGAVKLTKGVSVDLVAQLIGQFLGVGGVPPLL